MNKETLKKKIKVLLGMVKAEFETAKLADGSEISFDSLEINREVYNSEGTPLAEGEYVLEDGTKIEVDINGVIKEIERKDSVEKEEVITEEMACGEDKKKEEKMEETVEEETVVEEEKPVEETVEAAPEEVFVSKAEFDELKASVEEIYDMLLALTEKETETAAAVAETKETFSKYIASPAAEPVHYEKSSLISKLDALKELRTKH